MRYFAIFLMLLCAVLLPAQQNPTQPAAATEQRLLDVLLASMCALHHHDRIMAMMMEVVN